MKPARGLESSRDEARVNNDSCDFSLFVRRMVDGGLMSASELGRNLVV